MFRTKTLICWAVALLLCAGPAFSGHRETLQAIEDARASGELTPSRAALYRVYAHKAPDRLPQKFRLTQAKNLAGGAPEIDRCATLEITGVLRGLKAMDPADLAEARTLLGLDTPAATAAPKAFALGGQAKIVTHTLSNWVETPNFSIEWGSTLTNEDGTTQLRDLDLNGIPDVIDLWASYFEYAYAVEKALGFTDTPVLDTYKIQVLIANSDPTKTIDNMSPSYYGATYGDVPHVSGTPPAYMIVSNDFATIVTYIPNDESKTSFEAGVMGAMMVTAAHELNHVIQFIYAPSRWGTSNSNSTSNSQLDADSWFLEATSTWAEDEVFPYVNDYKQYFDPNYNNPGQFGIYGWQMFPEMTLAVDRNRSYANSTIKKNRVYGAAIFLKYVSEHLGGPGSVADTWTRLKTGNTIPQAVSGAATAAGTGTAWTMDDVFLGFAGANATMDYDDGALYGTTPRRQSSFPEIYGSALKDLGVVSGATKGFSLSGLTPSFNWGVSLVEAADTPEEKFALVLPARANSTTINAAAGTTLTGVAAFLGPSTTTLAYTTTFSDALASDVSPPSQVAGVSLSSVPQGLQVSWSAATDNVAVAGYLVEWKKSTDSKYLGRTIAGAMTRARIGNLAPLTDYNVRIFAYDAQGNRSLASETATWPSGAAWGRPVPEALGLPPVLAPIGARSVREKALLTFTLSASDPDSATLTFGAIGLPSGAVFDPDTRTFSWTPTNVQSGVYHVVFTVTDGTNTAWEDVAITVIDIDPATSGSGGGGCLIQALTR